MAPMRVVIAVFIVALVFAGPVGAQTPARQGAPAAAAKPATSANAGADARPVLPPLEPQGYTYDPDGRRDPFVSLMRRGADARRDVPGGRASGLGGLAASDLALKGIITSGTGYVAVAQGADNKTYILHVGDRLADGTVRAIDADSVVILQKVNDPLSAQKEREVRKVLRQTEEAK